MPEADHRDLLRLTTAGSVDDGKSTLIGRLLLESKALYQDQVETVRRVSEKRGHQGLDLSLFTDGLRDEREQKITIDVAYRYFSTARRKFIIADCPGHLQYTRNMVTGASTSELAVILVDARNGLVTQSKRHAFLSTLLGLPHLVVAVNKMDLVDYSQAVYDAVCDSFRDFATKLEVQSLTFLPISALHGDNVVQRSARMPWYQGSTLLHHLETVNVGATRNVVDFRFPVQLVIRPEQDYRGYAGRVVSGRVAVGEEVVVLPAGVVTRLEGIDVYQDSRSQADVGDSVVLRLADHVDVGRGDMIVRRNNLPMRSCDFDAVVCWLGSEALDLGKSYTLLHGTSRRPARVSALNYRIDVDTMHRDPATSLALNDIGRLRISTGIPLHFDPYRQNRETGCFLLVDPVSHDTVAGGMIRGISGDLSPAAESGRDAAIAGASNLHPSTAGSADPGRRPATVDPADLRSVPDSPGAAKPGGILRPAVVWLTGLSGAGKSTLAQALLARLRERGVAAFMLDGDVLRAGLCADLGFSPEARAENLRRAAHVAAMAWQQGMVVICSLISPFAADRALARSLVSEGAFLEVYLNCPLQVCRDRDPKGLYAKVARGELRDFTGVDSPYEPPQAPELVLDTSALTIEQSVDRLLGLWGPE